MSPPIFVDGVEINEVFVDGVEQNIVVVDGIEVFTSAQLEAMFDDYNRSPNGTPITSHIMNSGQGWAVLVDDRGTQIDPFQGEQAAVRNNPTNPGSAFLHIEPVPLDPPLPTAYHVVTTNGWRTTNPNSAFGRIYTNQRSTVIPNNQTYLQNNYDGSGNHEITITQNGVKTRTVNVGGSVTNEIIMEVWFDGPLRLIEGAVTILGTRFLTGVIGLVDTPVGADYIYQLRQTESRNFQTQGVAVKTYLFEPFESGQVPFP